MMMMQIARDFLRYIKDGIVVISIEEYNEKLIGKIQQQLEKFDFGREKIFLTRFSFYPELEELLFPEIRFPKGRLPFPGLSG